MPRTSSNNNYALIIRLGMLKVQKAEIERGERRGERRLLPEIETEIAALETILSSREDNN